MTKLTFTEEQRVRLVDIEKRAKNAGSNITQVCKNTGIARATYERWMQRAPQSVTKMDELEIEVSRMERDGTAARSRAEMSTKVSVATAPAAEPCPVCSHR